MSFTDSEVRYLNSYGYECDTSTNKAYKIEYNGFGHTSITKSINNEFIYKSLLPTNIDVDTGTFDIKCKTCYYHTFEDLKNYKSYKDIEVYE